MKRFFIFTVLVLFGTTGFTQRKDSSIIKLIAQLEAKRFDAQVNKNYAFLENIFSDDLVYVHSNGVVHNREEYIESIKNGKSAYQSIKQEKQDIRVYNKNAAVINGKVYIDLPSTHLHLMYTVVYAKKDKEWKVVSWQSLKLAD